LFINTHTADILRTVLLLLRQHFPLHLPFHR